MEALYDENDNTIYLEEVQDTGLTGDAKYYDGDDGLTVRVTVVDQDDVEITGLVWPQAMTYVAQPADTDLPWTPGTWKVRLPYTLPLTPGEQLTAIAEVITADDIRGKWRGPLEVRTRGGS